MHDEPMRDEPMRNEPMRDDRSRVIWLYCGFQFFFSLLFWVPVFYEYQKRIGLTDQQIFDIQSIYYVAFCLLEIPTGMAADMFGAWRCMRDGAMVLVAANLLPIFAQSYWGLVAHWLLIALARSFISGASSAYIYEYLARHDATAEFKQIEGNARAYGLVGKVVCWAFVGALMEWRLTSPYWLTVLSAAIAVGFAMALPDVVVPQSAQPEGVLSRLSSTGAVLVRSPFLALLMIQGTAIFVLSRLVQVNLFQPILKAQGYGVTAFGVVMALMTVFEAIGSARPGWVRAWLSDLNAVFVLTLVLAATMLAMPVAGPAGNVAALCAFALATGLSYPIQRQLMNDHIPDARYRATLLSAESIVDRAVCAILAPQIGLYLEAGKLDRFVSLSAVGTIGGVLLLWWVLLMRRR